MVKTENRIDLLTETFHNKLELDKLYSRSEIEDLMDKKMDYYYNVTALTYNRWNKGKHLSVFFESCFLNKLDVSDKVGKVNKVSSKGRIAKQKDI